jgi:hypothetical protein
MDAKQSCGLRAGSGIPPRRIYRITREMVYQYLRNAKLH